MKERSVKGVPEAPSAVHRAQMTVEVSTNGRVNVKFAGRGRSGCLAGLHVARDLGHHAVQAIPGVGSALAAIFVAEIGEISRFTLRPATSAAGRGRPRPTKSPSSRPPGPHHQARPSLGSPGPVEVLAHQRAW